MNNLPKKRVLLAEDDKVSAMIVSRGLEKAGFSVTVVDDGQAAEEKLASEPFDVFVTEWMMPGRDGIDVVRRLRARASGEQAALLVVVITALGIPAARAHALAAGADAFLAKPFAAATLSKILSAAQPAATGNVTPMTGSHAITRLPVWDVLDESTCAVIGETLNTEVSLTSGPAANDSIAYAVACAMTDAEHQLEFTLLLTASSASVGEVGRLMLDDASADVGESAIGERTNIVAGRLKDNFRGDGYHFNLAVYAEADQAKRDALQGLSLASAKTSILVAGCAELSAHFFVRQNGVTEISGDELFEGVVLAEDLIDALGAMILPAGTRLTSSGIKRVQDHVQNRRVKICNPKAA